jgi:hypothetical protein
MARKVPVSRHNLTVCPRCEAHIQVAADMRDTVCPFCQAALVAAPVARVMSGALRGALSTGRSGLLAAGLLGLSVSACTEEESHPIYGSPPGDTSSTDATSADGTSSADTDEVPTDPAYGGPPDTATQADTTTAEDVTAEDVPDTGNVELYGLPPDPTP